MTPKTTASSSVLDQLDAVREARDWGIRDCARMLDIHPGAFVQWPKRALASPHLRLLDTHARQFGHTVRLVLIEDNPGKPGPWRQRPPHGNDPTDAYSMTATWRLQQRLRNMRIAAGCDSAHLSDALGIRTLALWRLENSPAEIDRALANVLILARFLGYRIVFQLEPLDPGEVTGMGTWQTDDGRVYDDDGVLIEVDGEDPK